VRFGPILDAFFQVHPKRLGKASGTPLEKGISDAFSTRQAKGNQQATNRQFYVRL